MSKGKDRKLTVLAIRVGLTGGVVGNARRRTKVQQTDKAYGWMTESECDTTIRVGGSSGRNPALHCTSVAKRP